MVKKILVTSFVLSVFTMATQHDLSNYPASNDPEPDCDYDTEYDHTTNSCPDPKCPSDSIGIFPNCKCTTTNTDYSVSLNKCFRVCPDNSTGYWPNCKCTVGDTGFDKENFECTTCTPKAVSGIFPNCVCEDDYAQFNAHRNDCEFCPFKSSGKIPNCICDDGAGEI